METIDNCQAELKLFKVGEPLTVQADGNPEPSSSELSERACVETRQRVCIRCGGDIPHGKYKNARYCSISCRQKNADDNQRLKKGLPIGVGSGNNQFGENNSQWTGKSGAGGCMRAMRDLPNICNRCGSVKHLLAHHIDHDRTNNDLSNFEILCKSCHQKHHETRDSSGRYTKG